MSMRTNKSFFGQGVEKSLTRISMTIVDIVMLTPPRVYFSFTNQLTKKVSSYRAGRFSIISAHSGSTHHISAFATACYILFLLIYRQDCLFSVFPASR